MSKPELRAHLAALSFSEKIRILERLRKRDEAIVNAGLWKEGYIRSHLGNELHWLLRAASEWSMQDQLRLGIDGYQVQVYAMDSAFLHARTLLEFFLEESRNHYSAKDFIEDLLRSDYYENWKHPLHSHLMHAQDRSRPRKLKSRDGEKDLNQMPVYFAREVLWLWEQFESKLLKSSDERTKSLVEVARKVRDEAISSAKAVANSEVAQEHAKRKQIQLIPVSW